LSPGEGTFLGAGIPHAYLEGVAVEVMANSDNVVRGGLTPKHVDVPELLRILSFAPTTPVALAGERRGTAEHRFVTPADEFALSRLDVTSDAPIRVGPSAGPEALIAVEGTCVLEWPSGHMPLSRGGAVFIPPGLTYSLATREAALLFRAFVPI